MFLVIIAAVLHKDSDAYRQWVTYWLILYVCSMLNPFLTVAIHPILKLLGLLWLSLPRYQGASIIYDALICPLFHKYESHVDAHIDVATERARRTLIIFLAGSGWSILQNVMRAVQLAKSGERVGTNVHPKDPGPQRQNSVENSATDTQQQKTAEKPSQFLISDKQDATTADVQDFISMVSRGIYVFAVCDDASSNNVVGYRRKQIVHQLRFFAYSGSLHAFTLSHMEHHESSITVSVPIRDISRIEASSDDPCGMRIVTQDGTCVELVLSDSADCVTMLAGLNISLAYLNRRQLSGSRSRNEESTMAAPQRPSRRRYRASL